MNTSTAPAPAPLMEPEATPGSLFETMGFQRRTHFADGRAVVEYMAGPHLCHSGGIVQGGFVTGWIDQAMAMALMSLTGPEMTPISLEIKVSFFAPARPGLLIAEGRVEYAGRSTCFAEGDLRDARGKLLAKSTSTIRLIPRAKAEAASAAALAAMEGEG
ncbi:PaaI family thioesterase [Albimonas sp. CAU 1670]|uniref:PaaI family thioesterase n=1 Tax=Albimonas sp. CAU 1670 TaxID=3032599 RepID=UPI0023DAB22A|nr:PaaI family thioesterase [Albimonas sp. CAU 1670]MDF2235252.1 PaaI family thioesterase [Albimonas sp. CAU 1670]